MVGASDLKVYQSTGDLGGAITGTQIINATPNNLFDNVPSSQRIAGEDYYKCCFFKNSHATESMDNFKLWLTDKRDPNDTQVEWGFDSIARESIGFDGTDDYIDCGVETGLWSQALTKFSFSFWIWPSAGWDGNLRNCVNHGTASPQGFRCNIDDTDSGGISFRIRNAAGTEINAHSFTLTRFEWNHIVCVYDSTLGSANLKIYVDKVLGAATANLTETINQSVELRLGDSSTDFKGYMADFQWFTNTAVNQAQVDALYDYASNAPNPNYRLEMLEMTGNPGDIKSGNKEGVLTNGAYWNLDAQVIANRFTEPTDIDWLGLEPEPSQIQFKKLLAGDFFPIWIHYHVDPNAQSRLDDSELFAFKFQISQGGTGSSGGGTDPDPVGGGGTGGGGNPPPPSTDYKIAICGDWGCESETDDVIDLVKNGGYDVLWGIGDNAYASPGCWIDNFKGLRDSGKFQHSAYGNHEYSESDSPGAYKTFFGDNKTYYSFKYQNIFVVVVDDNDFEDGSAPSLAVGGTQHEFIKKALEDSQDDNLITWRVVLIHHPWFGASSQHENNEGDQAQRLHELFQNNFVNFVICGHNHNWQRTHQVSYNSGDPKSPNIVDNSSPYSATKKGIIHVVSGTGGHDPADNLYSLGGQPSFQAYQNKSHNGIFELVASNGGQTLTGSFVSVDGDRFGQFTITAT